RHEPSVARVAEEHRAIRDEHRRGNVEQPSGRVNSVAARERCGRALSEPRARVGYAVSGPASAGLSFPCEGTRMEQAVIERPAGSTAASNGYRVPHLAAALTTLGVFLLYTLTLSPTTWFWDTSEYIATAHMLGIPHPPGNPLFVLLA